MKSASLSMENMASFPSSTMEKESLFNFTKKKVTVTIKSYPYFLGLYIPELVLGNLLTGSNFNDSIAKVTGGRNGYGAKLTNIFSKQFTVETVDSQQGLKYTQTWKNNMGTREDPTITPGNAYGRYSIFIYSASQGKERRRRRSCWRLYQSYFYT
jgi:hypothetical protein